MGASIFAVNSPSTNFSTGLLEMKGDSIMLRAIRRFLSNRSGATAVEYSLVVAVVSVGAITAMDSLSATLIDLINQISDSIHSAVTHLAALG